MDTPVILNSKGEPIKLNPREQMIADYNQKIVNSLGFDFNVTTLTTIQKSVLEQKFFTIPFADYCPVRVGEGAWSQQLTTLRSFVLGDDFDTGVVETGTGGAKLAAADVGVDAVNVPVKNWAKTLQWTLFELQFAQKAGNWDIVTAKEKARKKNWDLGIQKMAFLGLKSQSSIKGLLNMTGVTVNTSRITKTISSMTATELQTFVSLVMEDYRANAVRTAMPTAFFIPESDFNGLGAPSDPNFSIKSKYQYLLEVFQLLTQNKSFKILPCAYADASNSSGILSHARYTLLNQDEESVRLDIPVDYTSTVANSVDGFTFNNVGYGQFSSVNAYRPAEALYFDNLNA